MKTCLKCGSKRVDDHAAECPQCGASFRTTRECLRCGREYEHILGTASAGYCPQCTTAGTFGTRARAPDVSGYQQMVRWGTILVVLGIGSFLLPLCGFQFRLMTLVMLPLGDYWWVVGMLAVLAGAALLALGYRSYMKAK